MEIAFSYVFAAGLCIGFVLLIAIAARGRARQGGLYRELLAVLITGLLAKAINILVTDAHLGPYAGLFIGGLTQPAVYVLLASAMIIAFTLLSLVYFGQRGGIIVLGVGVVWWVALAIVSVQAPDKTITIGQPGWLAKIFSAADVPGLLALIGWAVLGGVILFSALYSYVTSHLAEISNRAIYWMLIAPLVILGEVLGVSGSQFLKEIGWLVSFVGIIGAVYGASAYQVFDLRQVIRATVTAALTTGVVALVSFVTIAAALALDPNLPNRVLAIIGLSFATALAYIPLHGLVLGLMNRLFGSPREDPTSAVRLYSQKVTGVVELPEVSDLVIDMVRSSLRARHAGLILATRDDNDTIRLEPMESAFSSMPEVRGWIPKDSPLYVTLFDKLQVLRQYDLEFNQIYTGTAPELLSFFKQLRMSAYAPIVVQGQVIGLLAAGTKVNDDAYSIPELDLMATIAAQTGVALRNARLFTDIRKARDETQELNVDIIKTKERLEQLDRVKTDFITIASHELRTPLAQLRGYTDILEAVNEQGIVDPDQVTGLTNNLRKATDRLEQLIADMLDVSQLGLDAMDLRFSPTTIDNIMRLAIEPLAEAINQRKLQLTARGLKALPSVQADMQRLVQAFRNIVLNAIKYTPDGGRIDISAKAQQNEKTKQDEVVISIKDTGIGIDPKYHELIFEKFFRIADPGLHSTGATKFMGAGPGLGLTIARGMVEGHGGKIWVESPSYDPEKLPGTTVNILLPVNPPATAKRVKPFEGTSEGGKERPTSPLKKSVMMGR
ncbi:MAG: hypothetical protein IAE83_10335 [Anaerolinea sp.]|nr:hypothetical protein [Anaerolinea sp.]MCC6973809.1 hypothetical protein [Anaerolineae bacterium]CAG0980798.1 two-component system, sensor histidine kinase ChiS [Anaerolineae bacterium]